MTVREPPRPMAAVLLLVIGALLLVEALLFVVAGDDYAELIIDATERGMSEAGPMATGWVHSFFDRVLGLSVAVASATGLVHLIVGLLIPTRAWARVAGIVIAVMSVALTVPAAIGLVILPDFAVPRPLFMWLDPGIGVPTSVVAAGLLGAAYVVVIVDLAGRPPLREA